MSDSSAEAAQRMCRRRGWAQALAADVASLLICSAMLWPWMLHATHALPPPTPEFPVTDQYLVVWVLAWVARMLVTDPAHVWDANIFHPAPAQLTGAEHLGATAVLVAPLQWLSGNPVLSANVAALISYPLAAIAMRRLLLALDGGPLIAWIGGLIFAFGIDRPIVTLYITKVPHWYLPLLALCIVRLRQRPTVGRTVALAVAATAAGLSSYYLLVLAGVAAGVWLGFEVLALDAARRIGAGRDVEMRIIAVNLGRSAWPSTVPSGALWPSPPPDHHRPFPLQMAVAVRWTPFARAGETIPCFGGTALDAPQGESVDSAAMRRTRAVGG